MNAEQVIAQVVLALIGGAAAVIAGVHESYEEATPTSIIVKWLGITAIIPFLITLIHKAVLG